ncbi:monocarboxylate permease [Aspergillus pseudoustus]|uniref:Monocarboxylate permease n=1 Tax=Aspergillus pseudoustus TaxID=1810923 RepID=A0ABR4KW37_9EURO
MHMSKEEENHSPETLPSSPPPPDDGLKAWLQVLCMHLVFFNTWGVSNGFAVFQQLYTETLPQTSSEISWIGSVQISLLFFLGVFAGRATDAGYFRLVYTTGTFLQILGFAMLSLCKTYWQIFLTQAVCMGLGNGLTFGPGLAVMSSYFSRHRAVAVGIAAAGAATGGMVYPILINQLLHTHGLSFGWTVRAAAFVMLITQIPGVLLFKTRLPPRSSGPLIDPSALHEPPFLFFTLSMFLNFWGLYFAFFYMGTFARDRLGVRDTQPFILTLNAVGVVGRIVPGLIGDRFTGKLNILIPLSFVSAIVVYAWMAVSTVSGLYVFTVVYGLVGGAAQALFPATATTMAPDMSRAGTRIGMILSVVGFATLTGPAIDGALIQGMGGRYTGAQAFAGSVIFLGACAALAARVAKVGWELKVKV